MARAAVAAGADGLIIEVHPDPERALSDGVQSLYPDQFAQIDEGNSRDRSSGRTVHRITGARKRATGYRTKGHWLASVNPYF